KFVTCYQRGGGLVNMQTFIRLSLPLLAAVLLLMRGPAHGGEFVVGADTPLTGSLARVGNGMSEGISVAAEVFNRKSGKHKIKHITIDDESSPAKAVAALEKLASQNVIAISGGYGSGNIGPASDAANKAGLVYVTSGGVDEAVTQRGLK